MVYCQRLRATCLLSDVLCLESWQGELRFSGNSDCGRSDFCHIKSMLNTFKELLRLHLPPFLLQTWFLNQLILSEYYGAEHGSETIHNILVHVFFNLVGEVDLRVHLADTGDNKIVARLLRLFLDPLVVLFREPWKFLKCIDVCFMLLCVLSKL